MFCTSCGSRMNDGDLFCSRCGQRATVGGPAAPVKPSRPAPTPDEDGDEAVLYRKGHAFYFTGPNTWVTGAFVIAQGYIAFYPIHFIKSFRIMFSDIEAISGAYASLANTRFALRTKDGKVWEFSINTVDINETQTLIDNLSREANILKTFDPYATR